MSSASFFVYPPLDHSVAIVLPDKEHSTTGAFADDIKEGTISMKMDNGGTTNTFQLEPPIWHTAEYGQMIINPN